MRATLPHLLDRRFPALERRRPTTLQVNLGYRCNQSCLHCHVNAGPTRKEMMDEVNLALIIPVLSARHMQTLDLTGGAPELHPLFRDLVSEARRVGVKVIDRCNLTVLREPGQEDLGAFLAAGGIEIVASLPCYTAENVDRQRGDGVFEKSIAALRELNALGYGQAGSGLTLNLAYNPQGPRLPGAQSALEADYRRELRQHFSIEFNTLLTLTNMPIQRFGSMLLSRGEFNAYLELLRDNFVAENLENVMCRTLISVDWQGHLYDCDFNQQLGLPLGEEGTPRLHLRDLLGGDVTGKSIRVADHCFGCTAGQGSSCGGALAGAAP
ncbi:MAG: arsenosugar biosynthesis radical SAM protein ArsS [Betaproteobacteria bacterium]|nr:arsenosugar biosynthesis radical SAM protein ArsS [Betaproteobacteria bacterium]